MHAAEEYLFSRHSMYWQVYFHKTTRACEVLLKAVLTRAREVFEEGGALDIPPNLRFIYEMKTSHSPAWLDAFIGLDDTDLFHAIKLWRNASDETLRDLAHRFIDRRPYKALPLRDDDPEIIEAIREEVARAYGPRTRHYLHVDRPSDTAYDFYNPSARPRPGTPEIRVVTRPPDEWEEISVVAQTQAVRALSQEVTRAYVMVPEQCAAAARAIIESFARRGGS
jgi:HD superfamily phosphohydrolase